MSNLADLVESLAAWEVHADDPVRLRALAVELLNEGLSDDDVRVLGRYAQLIKPDAASAHRFLVELLADPARRKARVSTARILLGARR